MPFHVRRHERLDQLCDRLVTEELARALAAVADPALSLEERVHELRSRLKKTRAVVRLVRRHGGGPARRAQRDDDWLRDVARTLAPGREALVVPMTLHGLRVASGKSKHASDLTRLLEQAEAAARRQLSRAAQARIEGVLQQAATALRGRGSRLSYGSLSHPRRILLDGAVASYRAARRALAALPPAPSPEPLHRWRIRVKRLGYQLRLLRRIAPRSWRALGAPLERLGDQLGEAHDLVVLESWIASAAPISGPAARARLTAAITATRHQREREARSEGERLLRQKPRILRQRLKEAWRKWR